MNYRNILQFKGTWRNYQARVLEKADKYMKDGRIHIVAAPGSGKTTLGIELIARMNEVAIVLTPSITIREQWVARIAEGFLREGLEPTDYISQDLKNPRCITVATYQALHCAMNKYKGILDENGTTAGSLESDDKLSSEKTDEEVDYSGFDVIGEMKNAQVGLLCLDECHHLRSEWWKALEEFKQGLGSPKLVALTATPPYDSTPAMWKRYMDMCGEIDEEISVPELVKEGSLCPHQDYVYFNYPTDEEMQEIDKFKVRSEAMQKKLCEDTVFLEQLKTHRGLQGKMSEDELLTEGDYLSALLIYLNARGEQIPDGLRQKAGVRKLPALSAEWLETLLQGFLYDDAASYETTKEYREALTDEIKAQGLIEKKKVSFHVSEAIEKLLTNSKGKCQSILQITQNEYQTLGKGLRMLILTDYIRKEHEKNLGNLSTDVTALGVLPFFELLRRQVAQGQMPGLRIGVLCGTIVIIPAEAKQALIDAVGTSGKVMFSTIGELSELDYLKVSAVGDNHFLTQAVTDIFTQGHMQVLIGTKSLLGEGWDSPCINSLILASFVGSFMLSNQMRGRAIRTFKAQPDKNSNIWHLVCIIPKQDGQLSQNADADDYKELSQDFQLLSRRMEHFLGLCYTEDVIENGMERLSIITPPFSKEHVDEMNRGMLAYAAQRDTLRDRWNRALTKSDKPDIVDVTEVEDKAISDFTRKKSQKGLIGAGIGLAAGLALVFTPVALLGGAVALGSGIFGATRIAKMTKDNKPQFRLQSVGEAIYTAMNSQKMFETKGAQVCIEEGKNGRQAVYLTKASGKDKLLFAQNVRQFFSAVNDQRYLLVKSGGHNAEDGFYCVPDAFAKKKEDAELFYHYVKPYIGKYDLVYTRNESGKKVLLEGRMKSLADAGQRSSTQKRVKK